MLRKLKCYHLEKYNPKILGLLSKNIQRGIRLPRFFQIGSIELEPKQVT